mgnify:CR=1 FL=1
MIDSKTINTSLADVYDGNTALDMLLDFEAVLDNLHMYAYKNWDKGQVVSGPEISRYWIDVTLMYEKTDMPDPDAAMRLIKHGCYVYFQPDKFVHGQGITDDNEPPPEPTPNLATGQVPTRKHDRAKAAAKDMDGVDVWLVKISMPRHFVDEFKSNKISINGSEVDLSDVSSAYENDMDSVETEPQSDEFGDEDGF